MPLRFAEPASAAYAYPLTIRHLLDTAMTTSLDQEIVYRDKMRYTYRDLGERIGRLASVLEQTGAEQGTTVAVMDWDSHRYLEAFFAVPMMGAVLMTVNVRLSEAQIAYTIKHAKAEILIVHRDFFPIVETILPSLSLLKAIIVIADGEEIEAPFPVVGEYEALSAAASPEYPFQDFDENAVATTFYTSGTTGDPKGVCFSHRQIVLHALISKGAFGVSDFAIGLGYGDVYMPLTPMFHVHAWGVPFLATMLGLKQVYPGRYDPELLCRLRSEHRVTYSHCVPTVLRMILNAAEKTGADVEGWKICIGGSAFSKPLFYEARRRGFRLLTGYGMSETAAMASLARLEPGLVDDDQIANVMTAAGWPAPLLTARIVDENMNELPHDGSTRGELVLRAPWLTPCYVGDPAASEALWRGGWLHTQDVATIDAKGLIRIRDRLKDVVKTGGEWIDSIHLEGLVASVAGVSEVAVVAQRDVRWGERPLAVIVQKPGVTLTIDLINAPVEAAIDRGEITRYARLERFEIADQLPRTSVGKIDKKALRARYADTPHDA